MLYICKVNGQQTNKQQTTNDMTTTSITGQEVFENGTSVARMMTYGIKEGVDKMEQVIKNTYPADSATKIIEIINEVIKRYLHN